MEYIRSYTEEPHGSLQVKTIEDNVIRYNGKFFLVQTNEYKLNGSRKKSVTIVEMLEALYGSNDEMSRRTKVRIIEDEEERKELSDMLIEIGIQETISF